MMQATAVTDWHFTPPGLAPGLGRVRPSSPAPKSVAEQIHRECVLPVVDAASAAGFLQELGRRLPLFVVLRTQFFEQLVAEISPEELPALVNQASLEVGSEVRRWAESLDETSRAELEFAVAKLGGSNEVILRALESGTQVNEAHVPDLFRTAVVLDLLVFCLSDLAARRVWPETAPQLVNSFRYATLDYAAAARRTVTASRNDAAVVGGDVDGESGAEDRFWSSIATLSLVES